MTTDSMKMRDSATPLPTERELKLGYMTVHYYTGSESQVECAVVLKYGPSGAEVWAEPVKAKRSPKTLRAGDLRYPTWIIPEKKSLRHSAGGILWLAYVHHEDKEDLVRLLTASEDCRHARSAAAGIFGREHPILKTFDAQLELFWQQICSIYDKLCSGEAERSAGYLRAEAVRLKGAALRRSTETDNIMKQAAELTKSADFLDNGGNND